MKQRMAIETWLIKVKKTITHSFDSARSTPPNPKKFLVKKSNVGVLVFEISGLMSKLLHLWQSVSDSNMTRLRDESIRLEGVHKIVSNDDSFLLGLACAELVENLRLVAESVSRISQKCEDSNLRCFDRYFSEFANSGCDPNNWILVSKEMEIRNKKLDQFVTITATLRKEMDELVVLENGLKKLSQSNKEPKITELRQKIQWQKQQVKHLKEKSLWSRSFDTVTLLLAKSIFTTLAKIKGVFGIARSIPSSLPRSLSASASVHPSENPDIFSFISGPLMKSKTQQNLGFLELNSNMLKPPPSTLNANALALHYSNLIIVIEKMIKSPQLVGVDARDDLYDMLPNSIRFGLRGRLKGVGFTASDVVLATKWRDALQKILGWLAPLAHNMIKWQSERSFEQKNNMVVKNNVLLFQTLCFANREKTEAAIIELLVGLNYIWRFEREMNAKALFQCKEFLGSHS